MVGKLGVPKSLESSPCEHWHKLVWWGVLGRVGLKRKCPLFKTFLRTYTGVRTCFIKHFQVPPFSNLKTPTSSLSLLHIRAFAILYSECSAFLSAGERPERLWNNWCHFHRKCWFSALVFILEIRMERSGCFIMTGWKCVRQRFISVLLILTETCFLWQAHWVTDSLLVFYCYAGNQSKNYVVPLSGYSPSHQKTEDSRYKIGTFTVLHFRKFIFKNFF